MSAPDHPVHEASSLSGSGDRRDGPFLSALLEGMQEAVVAVDPDGRPVVVNSAMQRLLGRSDDAGMPAGGSVLLGWDRRRIADEDRPLVRALRGERVTGAELILVTAEGTERHIVVNSQALRGTHGELLGAVSIIHDVTEARQVDDAERQSLERVKALIRDISDIIVVLDEQGTILYASDSAQTVLGYNPVDFVGANAFELVHPDDLERVADVFVNRALHVDGAPGPLQFRVLDGNNHWRPVETITTVREEDDGKTVLVTVRDISQRQQAEDELRAKTAQVEEYARQLEVSNAELRTSQAAAFRANKAKSEFLSRMSHELRTPLNSVLGFAQLLSMMVDEDSEASESVEFILRGGRHLLNLINEVLDISRIESGVLSMSSEAVEAAPVIAEAVDALRPEAAARGVSLHVPEEASPDEPITVRADCQRLLQVLLNLVANAVKYNRSGGSVTVTASATTDGRVAIAVTDTGPGIRPEHLDRLFVAFDRLGAETTGIEGTGIGLSLSQGLTREMGGHLTVETDLGHGSTFTVLLPSAGASAGLTADETLTAVDAGTLDVLYIEDNPVNFRLMERALARRGTARLTGALTGDEGIARARALPPDLILLDLHLPDQSGVDVLEALLNDERTQDVPVIIVTADATPGLGTGLLARGAAGYLTKPLDLRALVQLIDSLTADAQGRKSKPL